MNIIYEEMPEEKEEKPVYNEIDKRTGKRFRTVGIYREYEPEVFSRYGNVTESKLKEYQQADKDATKKYIDSKKGQ